MTPLAPHPNSADVDGARVEIPDDVAAHPLVEVLRAAGHTAVKAGCVGGICRGACVVQLDGRPTATCDLPAARARGRVVRTAAGLAAEPAGAAVVQEFARRGALGCGYCTPGMVATAAALVEAALADASAAGNEPPPGAPTKGALDAAYQLPSAFDGHACPCTGYQGLRAGLDRAATGTASGIPARLDGAERAAGQVRFTADRATEQTLHGVLVAGTPGTAMDAPGAVSVVGAELFGAGAPVTLVVATSPAAAREMAARAVPADGTQPVADRPALAVAAGVGADELDDVLAGAADVVTESYRFAGGAPTPSERPAALAVRDGDRVRLWCTSPVPQAVRRQVAERLALPIDDVEVEPVARGGGDGPAGEDLLGAAAAAAAELTGKPVLVEATAEQHAAARRRPSGSVEVVTGCSAGGDVLARAVHIVLDLGPDAEPAGLERLLRLAAGLYPAPCIRVTGTGHRSGAALPVVGEAAVAEAAADVVFAIESHVDGLARRAGEDPVAYRRRQAPALATVLDALAPQRRHRLREDPTGRWRRGRGVAAFSVPASPGAGAEATASVDAGADAGAGVVIGTVVPDTASGLHTMLTGVVAEELRLPQTRIRVRQLPVGSAPTDTPSDGGSDGGRGVRVVAAAVAAAAGALREQLAAAGRTVPVAALAGISASGRADDAGDDATGVTMADVAVDTVTGRVVVERVVSVHDVGRVLDPDLARGAVVAGVVQGAGRALGLDVATAHVAPEVADVYVGEGITARALGPAPSVGVPAAVANAVRDAVGVRVTALPITPDALA